MSNPDSLWTEIVPLAPYSRFNVHLKLETNRSVTLTVTSMVCMESSNRSVAYAYALCQPTAEDLRKLADRLNHFAGLMAEKTEAAA